MKQRLLAALVSALLFGPALVASAPAAVAAGNPTCSLALPAPGASVRGTAVALNATATNAVSVRYYLGQTLLGSGANTYFGWFFSPDGGHTFGWDSTTVADGTYDLTCVATASDGSTGTSTPRSMRVDNTAPTVSIIVPTTGSVVMGSSVVLDASASDAGSGVSQVQFLVDGQAVGTAPPAFFGYALTWSSITAAPGVHAITATASDAAGNTSASSTVFVTVPDPDIAAPQAGAAVHGAVALNSTSADAVAVEYFLDGVAIGPGVSTPFGWFFSTDNGHTWGWDSTSVADGAHSLTAVGTRSDGTTTTSGALPLVVDNTAPVVSVTSPAAGAQLTGVSVPLQASASDGSGSGVGRVQLAVDGSIVGTAGTTPSGYTYAWNSERVANGTHTVTAIATDVAGNVTTSAPVSVSVSNSLQLVAQELGVASAASPRGNPPIVNDTVGAYKVNAADLGVTWDDGQGHVLMAFGDTVGAGWVGPGTTGGTDARSNTLARSSDANLGDGVQFDTMIQDTAGHAKQVLPFDRTLANEVAVTPTAGISVGTRQYLYYVSQRRNNADTNYGGFAYSDDDGQTWTRDPNAHWLQNAQGSDPFQYGTLVSSGGFVYLLGTPAYRSGGVSVARVDPASVLNKAAWQYWNGTTSQSNEAAATTVMPAAVGEASVWFSTALNQWIFVDTDPSQGILVRRAASLTGPWSAPTVVVSPSEYSGIYGGYVHPWSSGHDVYLMVSMWGPYAVFLFHATI